jgi:hypothetical protein
VRGEGIEDLAILIENRGVAHADRTSSLTRP